MSALRRRPFTEWLRTRLSTVSGIRIETMSAEDKTPSTPLGWQGQPNKPGTVFEPYGILIPMPASLQSTDLKFISSDVELMYTVTYYGTSITMVEDVADDARQIEAVLARATRPSYSDWTATAVKCPSMGGVGWNNQIDPAMYSESDTFVLSVTRG